ncbi:hypothetical protein [Lactobacillus sp.]|uniref:hypothetical protein n=1 Tax=Lactobacillus sp. TaxID=1591 RepID=UPI003EF0B66A
MDKLATMELADELAAAQDKILNGEEKLDTARVYQAIDDLGVLNDPISKYFDRTEDEYYETESDHYLALTNLSSKLGDLHDRILTNHVDGFVDKDEINFTYNHENAYADDTYVAREDMHVLVYGLKVIGATLAIAPEDVRSVLSKDAVLSLGLAAHALAENL